MDNTVHKKGRFTAHRPRRCSRRRRHGPLPGPSLLGTGTARASEPQRGGTLRIGLGHGSTTDSLDPATFENGFVSNMGMGGLFNYLTAVDETNQLAPELAAEWDATPDAKTWTFRIRKGVEFPQRQDRHARRHRRQPQLSPRRGFGLCGFEPVRAGWRTCVSMAMRVVIQLSEGNADYPYIMSDYHLGIQPSGRRGEHCRPTVRHRLWQLPDCRV